MAAGNIVKVHNRRKNITYSVYGIPEKLTRSFGMNCSGLMAWLCVPL